VSVKIDLTQVGAFRFILPEFRHDLSQISKILEKKQGEVLLMHGEPVAGIYIVAEGEGGVYAPGLSAPLLTMGAMSSFGEMSFLEKADASATIRTESAKATFVVILHQDLRALIETNSMIGMALFKGISTNLSQKLRTTTERVAQELGAGRQILLSLSNSDISESLESLPMVVSKQNDHIINTIKTSAQILEDLAKNLPSKSEHIQKLQNSIMATKDACLTYYPKLAHQMAVIVDFVRRMERFIQRVAQE
jgi:CRP-like cAMP-binding protein